MTSNDVDPSHRVVRELGGILLGEQSLSQVLVQVTKVAAEALPDARDVSVTLIDERRSRDRGDLRARSVAFHHDLAIDLDERQYTSDRGPCLDAAASGMTILVDTSQDEPYPEFCQAARHRNVPRTMSVGLTLPGRTVGALNIYAGPETDFTQGEVDLAEELAGFVGVAVANAARYEDAVNLSRDLEEAMQSRASIEQAKGILMERYDCDADRAFDMLRVASSKGNVKLRNVAARLVARAGRGDGGRGDGGST